MKYDLKGIFVIIDFNENFINLDQPTFLYHSQGSSIRIWWPLELYRTNGNKLKT